MRNTLVYFLNCTAWRMDAPGLFGGFHAAAALITVFAAVPAAVLAAHSIAGRDAAAGRQPGRSADCSFHLVRLLSAAGWTLAALELYKQLFIYYVINNGAYDFWYFPFQLCSVPMYLCILLPLVRGRVRSSFLTFMSGYTFVGAAAALIFPQDYLRSYITLTLHGFIWHGILLFISLTIFMTGNALPHAHQNNCNDKSKAGKSRKHAEQSLRSLLRTAALFALLCFTAVLINAAAEPYMRSAYAAGVIPNSYAAMFYLNPYHISPQPLVSDVQLAAGIPAGLILYALTIAVVSSLVTLLISAPISNKKQHSSDAESIT